METAKLGEKIVGNFATYESPVLGVANVDSLKQLRRSRPKKARPQVDLFWCFFVFLNMDDDNTTTTSTERDDGYNEYITPQRKRKKRSKIWRELIEGKNVQGERTVTCVHCNSILSIHRDSGTSHLKRHLESCANRPLGLTFEEDSDEENIFFDMNELRKEILNFNVEGGHSFTMVEEQGFRRMMKRATPKFKPFGRATTKRDLLKAYVLERDKLKDLLSNVSDDRILSITVDNATYNDAMISCLKRRLVPRGGLSCGETLFHVRCCAHIINLIVQKGLTCISGILDKIRSFIKLIIKSSHRSEEFYDCVEKIFHLNVKRKLNLDMHVRWNSTYKMLGTYLYFKDAFLHLISSHASFQSYIPLEDEWEKVSVIHNLLELFYEVTCMFSAVNYPTSNVYFKGAWMVHRHLLEA
ncbi:zinc finger BED domain-containing protein RICESLEEPER 4-like [Chenopodium quinoa]|uniref:zinc finger BED domain-containing protein RICESLEEPER 4-like n=1 Tax=Chenopodium quinoa TaxID=63459 RepID=UPI000B793B5C|nr:zinc finger BED domain-containing protein RICESLEEPER 4-like [Chenopodium quinoa]